MQVVREKRPEEAASNLSPRGRREAETKGRNWRTRCVGLTGFSLRFAPAAMGKGTGAGRSADAET